MTEHPDHQTLIRSSGLVDEVPGRVTVIIPAYNAGRFIARCLDSVNALDDPDFEVIVVDDCSTDDTVAICERYRITLLRSESRTGPAIARNRAADQASGSILAFTDADCVVPSDWLTTIRALLEDGPVVCGTYDPAPWQNAIGRFANMDWYLYWFRHMPEDTDSFSTGNVAFRRQAFFDRERLEEAFFHREAAAEDTLMALTLVDRYPIRCVPELRVVHQHRDKLIPFLRKHITTGYSRTLLSIAFPKEKVFQAKDIRLSFVLSQLLSFQLLLLSLPFIPLLGIWGLLVSGALLLFYTGLQLSSLRYIWQRERDLGFTLFSYGMIGVRNLGWTLGMLRAVLYCATFPHELRVASAWHQAREVSGGPEAPRRA
jgi:glycosyltransferase involved in cell wall biosynthesis